MSEYIFGKNSVLEALKNNIPVNRIFVSSTLKGKKDVIEKIRAFKNQIQIDITSKKDLDKLAGSMRSGGVCAIIPVIKTLSTIEALENAAFRNRDKPLILALDEIQDPRNIGAIIRSAVGSGFNAVIYPKNRQAGITGVVASTSAGACFRIPMHETVNLARTLDYLKKKGFWVYGTGLGKYETIYDASLAFPLVLVIGSEGKGMRRIVQKKCDKIITIPLQNDLESLNASVAAGILMFEIQRKSGTEK